MPSPNCGVCSGNGIWGAMDSHAKKQPIGGDINPDKGGGRMNTNTEFIIFEEEIKDKINYDRQSSFNDLFNIFKFASEVLTIGGKVTVKRLTNVDFSISSESELRAYKESFNKAQRDLNRRLIR